MIWARRIEMLVAALWLGLMVLAILNHNAFGAAVWAFFARGAIAKAARGGAR